jgi:transcription elongation factor Elf1
MDSYSINELYACTPEVEKGPLERLNPLTTEDSMNEAELVSVRLSAQHSRVGILLYGSLHFRGVNTALVVLTDVRNLRWRNHENHRWSPRTWGECYTAWEPSTAAGLYTLRIPCLGHVSVSASRAQMYVGTIEELDERPYPDMSEESDAAIIAGFPQWSSVMTIHEHYHYPEPEPPRYTCLVCGYPSLDDLPVGPSSARRAVTCPSCGFQFDHTDTDLHYTYEQWREKWIVDRMPWTSTDTPPPADWAPAEQVSRVVPAGPGHYICLVCGYPELTKPYGDEFHPTYEFCPCCGYQYGYDDNVWPPIDRRNTWIGEGMQWWRHGGPPEGWDPRQQLSRLDALPRDGQVNGLALTSMLSSF